VVPFTSQTYVFNYCYILFKFYILCSAKYHIPDLSLNICLEIISDKFLISAVYFFIVALFIANWEHLTK